MSQTLLPLFYFRMIKLNISAQFRSLRFEKRYSLQTVQRLKSVSPSAQFRFLTAALSFCVPLNTCTCRNDWLTYGSDRGFRLGEVVSSCVEKFSSSDVESLFVRSFSK